MAKLSASSRSKVKSSNFAIPGKAKTAAAKKRSGNYPIPDKGHAKSALGLVGRFGTSAEKKEVRSAVKRKFPTVSKMSKPRTK